jgi:hypothetical protein
VDAPRPYQGIVTVEAKTASKSDFSEEYSDGVESQARCLGKVRSRNRLARKPTMDPLVVFR